MTQLTTTQAAEILNVSAATVAHYLKCGKLTGDKSALMVDLASVNKRRADVIASKAVPRLAEIQATLETDSLTDDERELLAMRAEGKSLRQIAQVVGVSHPTIQRRIDKILR